MAIAQPPPPEVLALVAADHIYRDESTGKLFILGTRSAFGAAAFPFHCSNLAVYASMIDGRGETALRVRLVDVDEAREPVLEHETTVDFHDPTEEVEVVFRLEDLVFPRTRRLSLTNSRGGPIPTRTPIAHYPFGEPWSPLIAAHPIWSLL